MDGPTGNPPHLDRMIDEHADEHARLHPDAKDRRIAELEAEVAALRAEVRILTRAAR